MLKLCDMQPWPSRAVTINTKRIQSNQHGETISETSPFCTRWPRRKPKVVEWTPFHFVWVLLANQQLRSTWKQLCIALAHAAPTSCRSCLPSRRSMSAPCEHRLGSPPSHLRFLPRLENNDRCQLTTQVDGASISKNLQVVVFVHLPSLTQM